MIEWKPTGTAPKDGTLVLIIFEDGDICLARNHGNGDASHNDWWDMGGLDFDYGSSSPVGWLPRDSLPPTPLAHPDRSEGGNQGGS